MAGLSSVPDVEIDSEGKFKYILVKVSEGANESKLIVRGTKQAEFHPDIFAKVEPVMKTAGFDTEVQGGGKTLHEPGKSIKVFSKSTGYGKADHSLTVAILKTAFPDYASIVWTEED
eukprot:TRINITY_DN26143_c0_g1_i1.p1 TRINITY_DN26143_c0_g1~~TRINITY_DN26143_c0_g1_i1.p1  ORF type:complete len:134 (-),score=33.55 TRINITY_DN26143_c0_g1_i1:111-461(-)